MTTNQNIAKVSHYEVSASMEFSEIFKFDTIREAKEAYDKIVEELKTKVLEYKTDPYIEAIWMLNGKKVANPYTGDWDFREELSTWELYPFSVGNSYGSCRVSHEQCKNEAARYTEKDQKAFWKALNSAHYEAMLLESGF